MRAGGRALRARRARGQPLPVGRGPVDRGSRRDPSAGRAVVRGRLPVHGRHAQSHERRMDFVRRTGEWFIYYVLIALGGGWPWADRCDPRPRVSMSTKSPRGCCRQGGGRRDRGRVACRVEAAGRGEHGAGAHDALHAAVRGDAGRLGRRLRGDRSRRRLRPRPHQRLRRPAGGRPRARPVRMSARDLGVAGLDGPHPAGRRRQRLRPRRDGARRDDRANRRPRVHSRTERQRSASTSSSS